MGESLRELQENFQAYMLAEGDGILNAISSEQASAKERINIYRNGYSLRLLDILQKDFSYLKTIVGDELLEKMAHEYIKMYPSNHFSICTFSRHFSKFLSQSNYEPHYSEIAAFEWALSCALEEPDAYQVTINDLSQISPDSWPNIQFTLHPSVRLYQFHYNAPNIIHAVILDQEIPQATYSENPTDWMVWRFELNSYFESLSTEQLWMIQAISQNKTFAEICTGLCEWVAEEEVAQFAAGILANWIQSGIFSELKIAQESTQENGLLEEIET